LVSRHDEPLDTSDVPVGEQHPPRSLTEDLGDLIDDGRNYVEAEIAYQKSRAALIASKGKRGTVLALISFACLNSALIALVVGLVITLAPHLTPLGATAAVVGLLMGAAIVFALLARKRFRKLARVFEGTRP
jgi:hypothetical protein